MVLAYNKSPTAYELWSVPPLVAAIVVAFHVPVATVPKVVRLVLPAQVLRAVFCTLSRLRSVLTWVGVLL